MSIEKGSISINTENIFPIIKKWLYSEKDIFIRELVSNASDAISKLKKLSALGEAEGFSDAQYKITVSLNKEKKTIKIIDNGIGMTADEVKKYINQIAFSGAVDFLEKYKDKADDQQIIGHFGLGFYSSFMVSDKVEINTLSFQKGAQAVKWESDGDTEYEMSDSERTETGTEITLFMTEDSLEFLETFKMRETLKKYFSFLPYELYLIDECEKKEENEAKKDTDSKDENEEDESKEDDVKKDEPKPLNDTKPLWLKNPKDCTDEEYKEFYRNTFMDFNEPLFWIHLNMDYPFNMKGIIYFPKLRHEFETMEGQIKLFYNQVFVANNIKEVIPEFLLLLKGCIDCPDLPLNVSRSFLQNEGYVQKISNNITKKVADKLNTIFKKERDNYNKYWDDINPFVKYGCIKEEKFYDKVKDSLIYKTTEGEYLTLSEYLEKNKEKHENQVFYVTDENQQSQYVKMFKDNEMQAVILTTMIDNHYISFLETKNHEVKFLRIDSDISDSLKDTTEENDENANKEMTEKLEKVFKESTGIDTLKVKVESLKADATPAIITLSEQSRRMQEMTKMYGGMGMGNMFPSDETLVLNSKNSLVKALISMSGQEDKKEELDLISSHIYDLAMLSHKPLAPEAMSRFIERSNSILKKLV